MKLTQDQKVMIYAAALQGLLAGTNNVNNDPVEIGNRLIKELESQPSPDSSHQMD